MLQQVYTKDQIAVVIGDQWGDSASTHDLIGRWVEGINFEGRIIVGLVFDIRNTEDGIVVDVLTDTPVLHNPASFSTSLLVSTVEQVCHQCKGSEFVTASSGHISFYAGEVSDNIDDRIVCGHCSEEIVFAKSVYLGMEDEVYEIPV